jgi:hypothetical protein
MRRSFRTHRLGVYYTQGFSLGWYAVPRWGTAKIHPTTLAWPAPGGGVSMEMAIPHDGPVIGEASRTARWVPNDPPTYFLQPVFTFSPTVCKFRLNDLAPILAPTD